MNTENIHYCVYLLKFLIKAKIISHKNTEKQHDEQTEMSEYYTFNKETSSSAEEFLSVSKIIKSLKNHIAKNILIESVLNDSNLKQIDDADDKHNFIIMFEININKNVINLFFFSLILN